MNLQRQIMKGSKSDTGIETSILKIIILWHNVDHCETEDANPRNVN